MTGDLFSNDFFASFKGKQKVNLELGHRFNIFIDRAVCPRAAQVPGFGDNIKLVTANLDWNIVLESWILSAFRERFILNQASSKESFGCGSLFL